MRYSVGEGRERKVYYIDIYLFLKAILANPRAFSGLLGLFKFTSYLARLHMRLTEDHVAVRRVP